MKKDSKIIKKMGSDCKYCCLDEGIYSMVYFCNKESSSKANSRIICTDGFTETCKFYQKIKD